MKRNLAKLNRLTLFLVAFSVSIGSIMAQNSSLQRKNNSEKDSFINPDFAPFYHSVASGDPTSNAVVIWTRITPEDDFQTEIEVFYEVSKTIDFTQIVSQGSFITNSDRDFTVKVDITGLESDTYYFYRFNDGDIYSHTGRTKTAPENDVPNIKFAVLSGSDYTKGFYTGLAKISERNDIDLVIHTGDYIYEYGNLGEITREHYPAAEIYLLQDYRNRLSQYRLDPNLQRCHQLYPWVVIWDDHDIVVDALRDTSYRHNPDLGLYAARKYAAIKAFREWIPCRDPEVVDENDFYKNWWHFSYGNLLDLFTLDVRLYDRDMWAENIFSPEYNSEDAKIIGPEQLDWIKQNLLESDSKWKIVVNGLMFTHFKAFGYPLVMENWDGYPYERNQILNHLNDNEINNVVFLSGDFHCAFANNVPKNPYNIFDFNPINGDGSLAVEFIPPSLSSDNFDEGNDYGLGSADVAVGLITASNPHMRLIELEGHGYILFDVTEERAQAEFWFMEDIQDPENLTEYLHDIRLTNFNDNKLSTGDQPSPPKPFQPEIPTYDIVTNSQIETASPIVISCYPNPVIQTCYVNVVNEKEVECKIFVSDNNQRQINDIFTGKLNHGNFVFNLDFSNLAVGVYFINILVGEEKKAVKIIKN